MGEDEVDTMSEKIEKILLLSSLSILLASLFTLPAFAHLGDEAEKIPAVFIPQGDQNDGGTYIGPGGCKFCHLEYYDKWMKTNHSRAFERLVERGETKNASCLPCHTTGWDNKTKTYQFKDVTCEVCHGSGDISNNIAQQVVEIMYSRDNRSRDEIDDLLVQMNLTKKSMIRNLTSEMCGRCHQGKHRPTYEEWNRSDHKNALTTLKGQKTAKDTCMKCMGTEYFLAEEREKPTLNTSTLGITCVRCHDVKNPTEENLLRMPKKLLCESCHTMEEAKPGSAPHHAQSEMRRSTGGVDTDTYIYQPNAACADCHRYTYEYNQTGNGEPAITGHTFEINFNVCMKCHEGFPSAEEAEKYVENQQNEIMNMYNNTILKVNDAKNITARISGSEKDIYLHVYNESAFNIQLVSADASKGAHNPKYAKELIQKADIKAANIILGKPDARIQGIPGFGLLQGFAALLFVVLVLTRRQRN